MSFHLWSFREWTYFWFCPSVSGPSCSWCHAGVSYPSGCHTHSDPLSDIPAASRRLIPPDDASWNTSADIALLTSANQSCAASIHILFHNWLFGFVIMVAVFLNVRLILQLPEWLNTWLQPQSNIFRSTVMKRKKKKKCPATKLEYECNVRKWKRKQNPSLLIFSTLKKAYSRSLEELTAPPLVSKSKAGNERWADWSKSEFRFFSFPSKMSKMTKKTVTPSHTNKIKLSFSLRFCFYLAFFTFLLSVDVSVDQH